MFHIKDINNWLSDKTCFKEEKENEICEKLERKVKTDTYIIEDDVVKFRIESSTRCGWCEEFFPISEAVKLLHNEIVRIVKFKDLSHPSTIVINSWRMNLGSMCYGDALENKENAITYEKTKKIIYRYDRHRDIWIKDYEGIIDKKIIKEEEPLNIFKEYFNCKYELIETEEEFNDYLSSNLDCDTWCRRKLFEKMKELGLRDGFINNFADLIGNNLYKYHAMIELANEVKDKDTLMYLFTYKFGENKEK